MHAVLHGVDRDQFMARHRSNHIQVAYADDAAAADRVLAAKALTAAELGMQGQRLRWPRLTAPRCSNDGGLPRGRRRDGDHQGGRRVVGRRGLGRAERRHSTSSPQPGWFEHDAEAVWWADFRACVSEVLGQVDEPPAAVAVSGIGPCLLPADAEGSPLRPAILYGIDTRAEEQVRAMTERLGEERIAAAGVRPHLAGGRPEDGLAGRERAGGLGPYPEVLHGQLVPGAPADRASTCSTTTRQASAARSTTSRPATGTPRAGPRSRPDVLPPELYWAGEVVGEVSQRGRRATGMPAGTPVTAGTIDAWAEAESVLARDPGDVMVMYGSTMFLVAMTDTWRPSRQLWPTRGLRPETSCLAAGMATSGTVTEWWSRVTGAGFSELTGEAVHGAGRSDGLLLLPYFAGERTPLFDSGARGVLAGLTLHHSRGHVYRAILEGVAFGVRHNLEAMRDAGAGSTVCRRGWRHHRRALDPDRQRLTGPAAGRASRDGGCQLRRRDARGNRHRRGQRGADAQLEPG